MEVDYYQQLRLENPTTTKASWARLTIAIEYIQDNNPRCDADSCGKPAVANLRLVRTVMTVFGIEWQCVL